MNIKQLLIELNDHNISISLDGDDLLVNFEGDEIAASHVDKIKQHKPELITYLKKYASQEDFVPIDPVAEQESYPMSFMQRRLWILSQFPEASKAYIMPNQVDLSGDVDFEAFKKAVYAVIERHEILRTVFKEDESGEVRQWVLQTEALNFEIPLIDLSEQEHAEKTANAYIEQDGFKPFDLVNGPLIRACLFKLSSGKYRFYYIMHHIVSDGWSLGVLANDVFSYYNAYKNGQTPGIPPLKIQYKDYTSWHAAQLSPGKVRNDLDYWLEQFKGSIPAIEIPAERLRPGMKTNNGEILETFLSKEATRRLKKMTKDYEGTLFITLLGLWNVLLYRYTNQDDIVIGTAVAGRDHAYLEDQIGFYVNTLALKNSIPADKTFADFYAGIKANTLDAFSHQTIPFDFLVDELKIIRDMSRNPLFDIELTFQSVGSSVGEGGFYFTEETATDIHYRGKRNAKFDIEINALEIGPYLQLTLNYNTDIYSRELISQLLTHFHQLTNTILDNPNSSIGEYDFLSAAEKQQLLYAFNDTRQAYPSDKSVIELFEEQVLKTPDAIAIVYEQVRLSYRELNERSNQLAHYLAAKGVQADTLVPVCIERSAEMLIAILGIWKAGGAYVPLDPGNPEEHIHYMLGDTGAKVVLSSKQSKACLPSGGDIHIISLDEPGLLEQQPLTSPGIKISPQDLSYVIYTSGSTGRPKGVLVEHRGMLNHLFAKINDLKMDDRTVVAYTASYTFDISVWQMFSALICGGQTIVYTEQLILQPALLLNRMEEDKVSIVEFVPSYLAAVLLEELPVSLDNVQYLLVTGEAVGQPLLAQWFGHQHFGRIPVVNAYGPTEASDDITHHFMYATPESSNVPLGKPIQNLHLYILDARGQLCPFGMAGEICVSGIGVARGYLNREALTLEKFVTDPFRAGERMYKTGDLGRWLRDGTIQYLGRMDDQVKIRGNRIELGEVEKVLSEFEGIRNTVVAVQLINGEKSLVAYYTSDTAIDKTIIKGYLLQKLPDYMVPGYYVALDSIPLTANGKVDRKALPPIEEADIIRRAYIAPENEMEQQLVEIWQQVLGVEKVGTTDNFFELGGHSLKATQLMSTYFKAFKVRLKLQDLFSSTSIKEHVHLLSNTGKDSYIAIPRTDIAESYPVSNAQHMIWTLSQTREGLVSYNVPGVTGLDNDMDRASLEKALNTLIERHEILRTVFRGDEHGNVRQWILSPEELGFQMAYHDIREEADQEEFIRSYIYENDLFKPFDMENGPLFRVKLFRKSDGYLLYYLLHHIITDGLSGEIARRDVWVAYNAYKEQAQPSLPDLTIQYKDYASWQQQQLAENKYAHLRDYWMKQLAGEIPLLDLPAQKPRPKVKTHRGRYLQTYLSKELTKKMYAFSQEQGGSLFMTLLAVWNVLLSRYTAQHDITIGAPIAGRDYPDLENQLGCYINTLVLRNQVDTEKSFKWLYDRVKNSTLDAYHNQMYPFDLIVKDLNVKRNVSRSNVLFDIMLVLQNYEAKNAMPVVERDTTTIYDLGMRLAKLDIEIGYYERGEHILFRLKFNTDVYEQPLIEQLMRHFKQLAAALLEHADRAIKEVDFLTAAEKQQHVAEFNSTQADYGKGKTILDLLDVQAAEQADRTAIIFEDKVLSYQQLHEHARQLAGYLREKYGVLRDDLVGIKLERSEWLPVVVLGILRSGAAYVPIDTRYPQERIDYIVKDGNFKVLIDEAELEAFRSVRTNYGKSALPLVTQPEDVAYCIYTSGSTGTPKGVLNTHAGLYNRLVWMRDYLAVDQSAVFLQKTPYTFDVSVWELILPFITGTTLVVARPEGHKDPVYLQDLIEKRRVGIIHFVPSMLGAFLMDVKEDSCSSLSHIVCSGEELPAAMVETCKSILSTARIHNLYGPTEAGIDVTAIDLTNVDVAQQGVSIGAPVSNTSIYIVNESFQLQPLGVPGELWISGVQVAKGYLNLPQLTAERFLDDPFSPGKRVYRTGDIARWLPDGTIQYFGRMDNQVKIRGNRIEPGEIEKAISTFADIKWAIVAAKEVRNETALVAYYAADTAIDKDALRDYLQEKLPEYMVPGFYLALDHIPLTASGKVDRKALPAITGEDIIKSEYVAPRNEMESMLAKIWEQILGMEQVGIHDNFFRMGGDSILSIRLVSRINKQFDVTLSIGQLYEAGTIAEISELVKDNRNNAGDKDKIKEGIADRIDQLKNRVLNVIPNADRIEDIYPMSDIQKGMVTLSAVNPETGLYHQQAVFPVPAVDVDLFKQAFAYLVQKHPSLRTRFDLSTYGEEIQIIEKDRDFTIGYHDLQHLERAEQEAFIKEFMAAERKRPFNVESAALWRLDLFAASQATSVFLFQFHHAILDGWSHASLNTELFKVYRQLAKGISLEPEQLGATYKDAVIDELYEKENPDTIRFWQEELGDYKRLDIFSNETAAQGLTRVVDTEFKNKLEERCKTDNVPVRTVLYAAFVYALKSLTYEDDFVVGMVANNRPVMEDGDRILGCFLNSIPVRNRLERSYDLTWSSYFKHTAAQLTALKRKERLTLYEISKATNEPSVNGSPFFDVLFNYIDFHIYEEIGSEKRSVKEQQLNVDSFAITNTIFDFEVSHSGNSLVLAYKLRRPLSSGITLDTIHQWICQILAVYLHSPNSKLKETSLLSAEERNKVLSAFNATTVDYGTGKTLLELQKSTALSYPEAIAVSYQGNSLSFYEYDRLSGKVAAYLREHYGLQPNDLVGVRLERSEWLPVVIMGILKAGGAYVPIDVEYPEERLQYIASDSNYKLCIDEVLLDAIKAETDLNIQTQEEVNVTGNTLAYAIYTSGSTGNPKGVLNTHAGIYNRLLWMRDSLEIGPADIVLQKTPYTFDVSVSELLTPFITGSKLVIAEPGGHKDPLYLQEVIAAEKITIVHFVPSMLEIFLEGLDPSKCKSLKHVMCSGEALPALTVAEFKAKLPWVRIHNFYGPTEAAIEVTAVELTAVDTVSTGVSIGKPVANTRIYIVDKQMSPQPIGVPGELLIEGVQVARGYLNQAALTEAQFIDSPFNEGQRIYRTGDLAKWLPNGEIAYLGRIDDQVKVHGYRIEPGEIAYYLGEREDIETAVVLVRKSGSGQKELIAFIVAKKEQDVAALRTYLAAKLPFYMVPAHFVQVSEIPLNASGKIDKKRLLAADQVELFNRAAYVAPRNDKERALIAVCEAVLNRKDIGMTDSFYELGGDSIKSIQMVSRLRQMGYTLKVAEVLRTPVLEEMAKLLLLDENKADQSEVSGAVVLTPIQHYLFEHFPAPAHFNQAIALKCEEPLDLDILDQCLTEIVRHHDALRMVFKQHNGSWSQFNNDSGAKSYRIGSYDLTAAENPMEEMEVLSSQLQASFELAEGPLVKLGHFKLNDGERLVIIIHHLVIDGVSWRILIEDLLTLYRQIRKKEAVSLPHKTDSFQRWALLQKEYAGSDKLLNEAGFWRNICRQEIPAIPTDHAQEGKVFLEDRLIFALSEETTQLLQTKFHKTYNTEINDVLLAGLGLAIKEVLGRDQVLVKMEGHGREEITGKVDVSRTIGWFTTVYPFMLDLTNAANAVEGLIKVKEGLRKIPNKGIGYGMLRYLNEAHRDMEFSPSVLFNYLGDFDTSFTAKNNTGFTYTSAAIGDSISKENKDDVLLSVSGSVASNKLHMSVTYARSLFNEATIQELLAAYKKHLTDLIETVSRENNTIKTPSDLSFAGLSVDDLNAINQKQDIEDIYELSPLQEGIYYHWLTSKSRSVYFQQLSYSISTRDLQIDKIRAAFQMLVERHAVLRTSFVHDLAEVPLQIVRKYVEAACYYESLPADLNDTDREALIRQYKLRDREEGFDLADTSLMRLKILNVGGDRYEFIWSFHHILMDGWCIGILIQDFNLLLKSLGQHVPADIPKAKPYSGYINWLKGIDTGASLNYWKDYLADYTSVASIPFVSNHQQEIYKAGLSSVVLEGVLLDRVQSLCNKLEITPGSFLQTAWGFLLSKYNNTDDVVFGTVVSGRPAELDGVENMVGLFINTIPVRIRYEQDHTPLSLLKAVHQSSIDSNPHHYLNLAGIQSRSEVGADLINHIMVFENFPVKEALKRNASEGTTERNVHIESLEVFEQTNYDFNILVFPSGNLLQVDFRFNAGKYEAGSIDALSGHFYRVIEQFVALADHPLSRIDLLSNEERRLIFDEFNATAVVYEQGKTVLDLFSERVSEFPAAMAVSYQGIGLSYGELDLAAAKLAHYLRVHYQVGLNDLVGIKLERGIPMLVAVLGVLKAGAAYVPIDTGYPEERLRYIKSDSNYKVCIDEALLEAVKEEKAGSTQTLEDLNLTGDTLAYAIYTSGSTGKPKGVVNTHAGLYNRLLWMRDDLGINASDIILQKTPYTFDVSVWELLMPAITGAKLVFADPGAHKDPLYLQQLIAAEQITILHFVPAMLGAFLEDLDTAKCRSLKHVVCSGEALPAAMVAELKSKLPWVRIHNLYGPTEAAIDVTAIELTAVDTLSTGVSIGKPVANTRIYIVDKHLSLQPVGVPGELLIEGIQVANGYLNQAALTEEKFIDSPFNEGYRIYRTGDLAKWLPNGEIAYIGRIDQQVKIRGNRIELGEIEAKILESGYVAQAAALVKGEGTSLKYLVAYVIPAGQYSEDLLYAYLKAQLPEYMIPAWILEMEEFPLTISGKLDRKALPEAKGDAFISAAYVAPRNKLEADLAEIWAAVLNLNKVGVHDQFFRTGGDSILAIRLLSRMNKRCNTTITIAQLYEFDTIASLSSLIEKGSTGSAGKEKAENEIAERIAQLKQQVLESMPDKDNVEDVYPMRDIQKGMVLLSSINQAAGMYHDQFVYHVQSIRLEAFEQALSILVKQHPALRTSFDLTAFDEEVQIVHKTIDFKIKRKDIQHLTVREQEAFINGFMVEERKIPFDTRTAPLWRVDLFRISAETEVLLFQFHHAILDGWSVAALHTELFRIYHELSADAAYSPAPLKASDKQAVIEELLEKNNQDNIQFWKDELKDYQRVAIFSNNPVYKTFTNIYVPAFKQELLEKCREDGISVKSLTYGALVYVMKVLSNESDFIIGSVSNNRPVIEDGDRLLGCFLNTTPVRNKMEGMDDLSWRKYFRRIDEQLNGLKRRERTTLYEIVKHSGEKEMEGSPFFDVLYNYIDFHIYNEMFFRGDDRPGKSTGQQLAVPIFESTNTALGLTVNVSGNAFVLTYTLNRELKVDITLERIHECVDHILSAYLHSPDLQLKETGLVAEAEKQKLLYTLNDTRRDCPENEIFLDMFEKQVIQSPQATALVFEGAELSYKALDEQSNRLAHYLLAQGVQKGELVPVYLERSSEMIISILAILKAGAAYLPIDTGNPVERVNFMLDDSGARFVLSHTLFTAFFDVQKITPIFVDDLQYQDLPVLKTAVQLKGEDLTYVIYTSGSTGKPKGVLISHSSLASRLHFYKRYYELSQADNILFYRSFSFDGAIEEYLLPFAIGAKCIIAGPAFKDHLFNNIIDHIERFKISKVNMPPILLQDVIEALPADQIHRISSLRHIVSGGDKLNEEVVSNFYWKTGDLVQATLYNSYGPTENTIDSTILKLDRNVKVVSIGKPIDNTAVYILDKHNRLLPFGMTGEICVSGAGLAKGYLKREALTAEKFIPNPFREGERLYKTGDLGRWLPDGNIAFIGRIDNQVKIRGHRIELGEIESSILQSGYVENAAVLVKTSADMRKYLLAYVITKEGYQRELLYAYLKNHLPAYMLPGMVIEVAAFPLTTNGKLNLEALPEPEEQHTITESYVEPGNETETQLVEIWKQLLNLKQIGIRDNFFQLGGDSLTVVKLQHRLQTTFGTPVSIVDLFSNTSVEKQALLLQKDLKMKEEEKPAEALKF